MEGQVWRVKHGESSLEGRGKQGVVACRATMLDLTASAHQDGDATSHGTGACAPSSSINSRRDTVRTQNCVPVC